MTKIPRCIGIILDGNRRWAREKGLVTLEGHRKGLENLKQIARATRDAGIANLVVYAFSTENWNRSPEEVSYLMDMLERAAQEEFAQLLQENIRIRFAGERKDLSERTKRTIKKIEKESAENNAMTLWVLFSYGGRMEIVQATQELSKRGEEITENAISKHLWTSGMPDPDIIIRTGGEKRLSNFLPWQGIYSELFFVKQYWPDFTEKDLLAILEEFKTRERRMGT